MNEIIFSTITNEDDIEILRSKSSRYGDFIYKYNDITLDLLKKNLSRVGSLYIVVKQDNNFVAFCSTDTEWWEKGYYMIREIFVEPKFQKMKIGETLIKKCIEHAKNNGAVGLVTETDFSNLPMQKLCERIGFKKWINPKWKDGITYKMDF